MDFSIFDSFDMSVFAFFGEQIQSATMNIVAEFITFFGGGSFVTPMAIVGALLIPFKKTRKFGMAVLFAVLVGTLLTNLVMKPLFARPRPYIYYADNPIFMSWHEFAGSHLESEKSFPSGHTGCVFAVASVLFFMMPKKVGIPAMIVASLVGISRLYVGVHYPTDIIGGFIISSFIGCVLFAVLFIF